jgi:hypothetical protein
LVSMITMQDKIWKNKRVKCMYKCAKEKKCIIGLTMTMNDAKNLNAEEVYGMAWRSRRRADGRKTFIYKTGAITDNDNTRWDA